MTQFLVAIFFVFLLLPGLSLEAADTPKEKCLGSIECQAKLSSNAQKLLGSRYSYGSKGGRGFDCSGLMLTLIGSLIDCKLPRSSQDMYASLKESISLDQAKVGDLLFFYTGRGVSHVGMYWGRDSQGNHIMYHASSSNGVEKRNLNQSKYWMSRLAGVKRYDPLSKALFGKPANPFEQYIKDEIILSQLDLYIDSDLLEMI
ncbi:MAG: C40 family peptidase [Candidatus Caenarcaniphilales bacterium]|nr:C40 family peptidase [Candidatus Caenarcaniphilales bacterium]